MTQENLTEHVKDLFNHNSLEQIDGILKGMASSYALLKKSGDALEAAVIMLHIYEGIRLEYNKRKGIV